MKYIKLFENFDMSEKMSADEASIYQDVAKKVIEDFGYYVIDSNIEYEEDVKEDPIINVIVKGDFDDADVKRLGRELRDDLDLDDTPRIGVYSKKNGYEDVPAGHEKIQIDLWK